TFRVEEPAGFLLTQRLAVGHCNHHRQGSDRQLSRYPALLLPCFRICLYGRSEYLNPKTGMIYQRRRAARGYDASVLPASLHPCRIPPHSVLQAAWRFSFVLSPESEAVLLHPAAHRTPIRHAPEGSFWS